MVDDREKQLGGEVQQVADRSGACAVVGRAALLRPDLSRELEELLARAVVFADEAV